MKVLYQFTAPTPAFSETDAVYQEVQHLQQHVESESINLFPFKHPNRWYPRTLYGRHCLSKLHELDRQVDIHQVHHASLYPFPILKKLYKPVVFRVVAGIDPVFLKKNKTPLKNIQHIVVSNERDEQLLKENKMEQCTLIRPGINISSFSCPPPPTTTFTILAGSAPWVRQQFQSKGVDTLLQALSQLSDIRIKFLWRGHHYRTMLNKVRHFGVEDRVEIINRKVNVQKLLKDTHAAIVLASTPHIVKAYPHSLLESLAAGRPVLLNSVIPMADYVEENQCGCVMQQISVAALAENIERLKDHYEDYCQQASACSKDFSLDVLISRFKTLYGELS